MGPFADDIEKNSGIHGHWTKETEMVQKQTLAQDICRKKMCKDPRKRSLHCGKQNDKHFFYTHSVFWT